MGKVIKQWWQVFRSGKQVLRGQARGQSLVIVTFAFVGILAFVGLAVDLGWVYVERIRVAQAADAAALAGASELPLEEPAYRRALVYLQENGYDHEADDVQVIYNDPSRPPDDDLYISTIWVDTAYSRDGDEPDTSDRIRVRVRRRVFMTFMQFIGFRYVPVEATAQAENINNIDTVIVYDRSGSMQFDTLCFGCWESSAAQYPSGVIYPLFWSATESDVPDHCLDNNQYDKTGDPDDIQEGEIYIVIEAELYSRLSVAYTRPTTNPLRITRAITTPYKTYWVMQRNAYNEYYDTDVGAMGWDVDTGATEWNGGAYLSHHPFADYRTTSGLGVVCTWDDVSDGYCRRDLPADAEGPFPAPRVDYDFTVPREDTYYIWVRGQGGSSTDDRNIFWGRDGQLYGQEGGFPDGAYYDGARGDAWEWRRLGRGERGNEGDAVSFITGTHTLNLWAGGPGFDVDRIIITTDSSSSLSPDVRGMPPHDGRTGLACDSCDPRFAGRPGGYQGEGYYRPNCPVDQRYDAIYDDHQPIRGALEAAKYFVSRLDPRLDQVGYVPYSDQAEIRNQLECVRHRGSPNLDSPSCNPSACSPGAEPPCDEDCGCFAGVFTNTVLYELDRTRTGNYTNIAHGMKQGIQTLGVEDDSPPPYGRPGSAHVMVLLTDGVANRTPPGDSCGGAEECVRYYAGVARNENIVIYTISLGRSSDRALMTEVANLTQGRSYYAPTTDRLNEIFDELYERIFLRLIR